MRVQKLPDALNGCKTVQEWEDKKSDLRNTVMKEEYGVRPDIPYEASYKLVETELDAVEKTATRKTYEVCVKTALGKWTYPVYLWLPNTEGAVPLNLFLSVRKRKPHPMSLPEGETMESLMQKLLPLVRHPERSMPNERPQKGVPFHMDRDIDTEYWPVRMCLQEKIAMAGIYLDDVELDDSNVYPSGLAAIFSKEDVRKEHEWGALSVWAFGASLALDCILTSENIDKQHISVTGHSRAGKAAIVAAINDERFTTTISNESGCCGSAISRDKEGENVMTIQIAFPHWFAPAFKKYSNKEDMLPFDQHNTLSLLAPRKLYVASGANDCWSGPVWEYEGIKEASKVWDLYGETSEFTEELPEINTPLQQSSLAYHRREGGHALKEYDWKQFIKYMK